MSPLCNYGAMWCHICASNTGPVLPSTVALSGGSLPSSTWMLLCFFLSSLMQTRDLVDWMGLSFIQTSSHSSLFNHVPLDFLHLKHGLKIIPMVAKCLNFGFSSMQISYTWLGLVVVDNAIVSQENWRRTHKITISDGCPDNMNKRRR